MHPLCWSGVPRTRAFHVPNAPRFTGLMPLHLCSDDGDPTTRPPLLVTATVETIVLRGKRITLDQDMEVTD